MPSLIISLLNLGSKTRTRFARSLQTKEKYSSSFLSMTVAISLRLALLDSMKLLQVRRRERNVLIEMLRVEYVVPDWYSVSSAAFCRKLQTHIHLSHLHSLIAKERRSEDFSVIMLKTRFDLYVVDIILKVEDQRVGKSSEGIDAEVPKLFLVD